MAVKGTELDLLGGLVAGDIDRLIVRLTTNTSVAPDSGISSGWLSALGPWPSSEPAGRPSEDTEAPGKAGKAGHAGSSTEDAPPLPPNVAVEGEVAQASGVTSGDAIAPGPAEEKGEEKGQANRYMADNLS